MFDIAYKFSTKWRFQYSPTKCKIIIIGKDTNPRLKVKLGESNFEVSTCETHLGVPLTGDTKGKKNTLM